MIAVSCVVVGTVADGEVVELLVEAEVLVDEVETVGASVDDVGTAVTAIVWEDSVATFCVLLHPAKEANRQHRTGNPSRLACLLN